MRVFFFFFLNKENKEENSTAPQKANVMVEICWRKRRKNLKMII